jgi:hypothetical protein
MLNIRLLQNDTDMDAYGVPSSQLALCSLPVECTQTILGHLPDLQALKSAILSFPIKHCTLSVLSSGQGAVLQVIMLGMISPGLLPGAVFAFNSSRFEVEP